MKILKFYKPFRDTMDLPLVLIVLIASLALQCFGIDRGIIIAVDFVASVLFVLLFAKYANLFHMDAYDVVFLCFLGWVLLSQWVNVVFNPEYVQYSNEMFRVSSFRPFFQIIRILFLFVFYKVLKGYLITNNTKIEQILYVLNLSLLVLCVYGVYQFVAFEYDLPFSNIKMIRHSGLATRSLFSDGGIIKRIFATFKEPSNYGHFLVMALFFQFGICEVYKRKLYSVVLCLLVLNLFLTFARGAIAAFFITYIGALFFVNTRKYVKVSLLLVSSFLGLYLILQLVYHLNIDFMDYIGETLHSYNYGYDASSMRILNQTAEAISLGLKHPVFGVGLGNAVMLLKDGRQIGAIRGLLPNMFANTGVAGVIFLFIFLCMHVITPALLKKNILPYHKFHVLAKYAHLAILCGLLQMTFTYTGGFVLVYFWFYLACAAAFNYLYCVRERKGIVD